MPTFPVIYMLIGLGIFPLFKGIKKHKNKIIFQFTLAFLLIWYIISCLLAFPHYIPYYNELAGGTEKGYKIAVDSNYDWGQDLKRLSLFVEKNNIEKMQVLYFGQEDVSYRLKDKWSELDISAGPQKGWIAISAAYLTAFGGPLVKGYDDPEYFAQLSWLIKEHEPVSRAGKSIFIYYID